MPRTISFRKAKQQAREAIKQYYQPKRIIKKPVSIIPLWVLLIISSILTYIFPFLFQNNTIILSPRSDTYSLPSTPSSTVSFSSFGSSVCLCHMVDSECSSCNPSGDELSTFSFDSSDSDVTCIYYYREISVEL